MKEKHTPGPWNRNKAGFIYAPDGENHIVKVAEAGDFSDKDLLPFNKDRWSADANLIAAAPDLLEALEKALEALKSVEWEIDLGVIVQAEKALKKAKGGKE